MASGLKEKLEEDIEKARKLIYGIQKNPETNYLVIEQDYLNPKRINTLVEDHHPDGSLMYFVGVQMALESVLNMGFIPREYVDGMISRFRPPGYLRPLVERPPEMPSKQQIL